MNTSSTTAQAAGKDLAGVRDDLMTEGAARAARRLARQRALRRMRQSRAFTLIELLIVLEVTMILSGMALPSIKTTRKQAAETNAVLTLRQMSDAQELYRPRQAPPTYAMSFEELRDAGLIDATLTSADDKSYVERTGYRFIMWKDPNGNTYAFTATAEVQGRTGDRSFYVDQTGVIRMASDASVSPFSPPLE